MTAYQFFLVPPKSPLMRIVWVCCLVVAFLAGGVLRGLVS